MSVTKKVLDVYLNSELTDLYLKVMTKKFIKYVRIHANDATVSAYHEHRKA